MLGYIRQKEHDPVPFDSAQFVGQGVGQLSCDCVDRAVRELNVIKVEIGFIRVIFHVA